MKTIKEMRERAAELATEARTELEKITDKTEEGQVKEIEARFDEMMKDHDKLHARADREQRLLDAEQRGMPSEPKGDPLESRDAPEEKSPEYREVFTKAIRFGAATLDSEEREVLMSHRDDIPAEVRAQAAGTDSAGGFTVPEDFSGEVDKAMAIWGPMWDANICRELNTANGRDFPWPTVDDTAARGRIKTENADVDDDGTDDVTFGERRMGAFVYDTGMVKVPLELLQDSAFNMETMLADLFGERMGRTANEALTTGTGSGQPNGIVTASSAGKTAAGAAALTADELIDLQHSVDAAYRASPLCRWQFNDTTLAYIRKLKDGDGNYLWQMGDVRVGEPSTILGHPYSVNQAMDDVEASARSVIFGDHSRYVVRKVLGFQVITLRERYAEAFQVGMVGFKRFDGELLNTAAVKHLVHPAS